MTDIRGPLRTWVCNVLSVVAPMGVHIRTSQIIGSFIIINGIINVATKWRREKQSPPAHPQAVPGTD